jgi:AcrR family transcriptional regulator
VTRPTAAPGKGERRRQEILLAARSLLVDDGYDFFVMREVAARVGATLGNLQYYFATRDDLLEAVVRSEFERNQREVAALSSGRRAPRAKLAAIVRHLIDVWAKEGGRVYAVLSLLAIHHRRFARLHHEIYEAFYESLLPVLGELRPGAKAGELRRIARLVTTLVDGALLQVPDRAFLADTIAAATDIAASGVSRREA